MKSLTKPAKQWIPRVAWVMLLLTAACGQSFVVRTTPTIQLTVPRIEQDVHGLPGVRLILGDSQFAGTLAAGGTTLWHVDPALSLPNIQTAMLPAQSKVVIAIDSDSVQSFTVTVRPWNRDGTIIPLVDGSSRQLAIEAHQAVGPTILTLEAIGNTDDQLLNINIVFKDSWGFFLWRLNPEP
jgi:hypothetical protein